MVRENTNTSQYALVQKGNYLLTVVGIPEKRRSESGQSTYRIWKFSYLKGSERYSFNVLCFPWESEELLLAVGGIKQDDGTVEWDDEQVAGKSFRADVVHRADNKGKMREKLENIQAVDTDEPPF